MNAHQHFHHSSPNRPSFRPLLEFRVTPVSVMSRALTGHISLGVFLGCALFGFRVHLLPAVCSFHVALWLCDALRSMRCARLSIRLPLFFWRLIVACGCLSGCCDSDCCHTSLSRGLTVAVSILWPPEVPICVISILFSPVSAEDDADSTSVHLRRIKG